MTTQHTCEINLCADDYRGDYGGLKFANALCGAIVKAEGAIKANGCELHKYLVSNTPTKELNPRGDIVTITFYIVSPFQADDMKLELRNIYCASDGFMPSTNTLTVNLTFKLE